MLKITINVWKYTAEILYILGNFINSVCTLVWLANLYVKRNKESFKMLFDTPRRFLNLVWNAKKYFYLDFLQFKDLFRDWSILIGFP